MQAVTGEFVAFTSSDDRVMPEFFERCMGMLDRYPEASMSTGTNGVIDQSDTARPVGRCIPPPGFYSPPELTGLFRRGFSIGALTTIVRRSTLMASGGFPEDLRWYSDWFTLQLIAFREGLCIVPEMVAARRVLADSYSGSAGRSERAAVALRICARLDEPEYADVRPYFRSGALAALRWPLALGLLTHPRQWRWVSWPYVRLLAMDAVRSVTPVSVRRWHSARRVRRRSGRLP
jgi:hypothetical protein